MPGNSRILTVRILSDASGVGKGLASAQAQYGKFGAALGTKSKTAGVAVGNSLVNGIDKVLGTGLKIAGAAGGLLLGTALFQGFNRLNAIDQATAKLKGLGHSAATVDTIMANSLASVKGTAFGLDAAATTAASVVAAGIKPGRQLESVLTTVADTATIAGSSMDDMGAIFGKVAAKNKLQGDVINQLTSAGIPVLDLLAKHYGITAEAASEMVSKGQVDFDNFAEAMKTGMGGAALEAGDTFKGAWDNTLAALGRIGENLLSPLFSGAKEGLKGIPDLLEPIEKWAKSAGQAIADMGKWAKENAGLLKGLGIAGGVAIAVLLGFRIVVGIMTAYRAVLAVVKAFQIGYAAASYGSAAASYAGAAGTLAQNIALVAGKAAFLVVAGAQAVATAAQWAFNAAMSANPIMLIIIVIVALVAAFILLWIKCEGFRNFWIGLWAGIQAVVAAVVAWFQAAWANVIGWLTGYMQTVSSRFSAVFAVAKAVVAAVVAWFRSAWANVIGWLTGYIQTVSSRFSAVFAVIRSIVSGVVSFFSSAWQGAVNAVNSVVRTVQGVFQSVFNAVLAPINAVSSAIQSVVSWVQKAIDWISRIKIPDVLGGIAGLFQSGTVTYTGAGAGPTPFSALSSPTMARLPALRSLPTLQALGAGGGDVTVINVDGGLDSADTIARRIEQLMTNRHRRAGGVTVNRRAA